MNFKISPYILYIDSIFLSNMCLYIYRYIYLYEMYVGSGRLYGNISC